VNVWKLTIEDTVEDRILEVCAFLVYSQREVEFCPVCFLAAGEETYSGTVCVIRRGLAEGGYVGQG
jgi:hypothetical protein